MSATAQNTAKNAAPKTAITPTRAEDFPEWYQQVIKAADLAENAPVRGCMIIKPYGYAIWENIQRLLDDKIKDCGVQNAYFPLLIPIEYLSKEAEHIDGFAKECAVVTHHRLEKDAAGKLVPAPAAKLEAPFVIRPTSETIIGEAMAGWINSYRDLPYKLNQWCNVMRWELRPRIFLRTTEFLWQEGHNAFASAEEARADALHMLGVYREFMENSLALPVFAGEKTADERFPGAIATYTVEAMMQDGKALQAGTSHDLGQTFSKSANIKFQGRDGQEHFAHTTSWGVSTRSIGGLIMTHGDDDGVIMPPAVAPYPVVIIPFVKDEAGRGAVIAHCQKLAAQIKSLGIRVHVDVTEERSSNKMWKYIKSGVPLRVEVGDKEMAAGQVTVTPRDLGKDAKQTIGTDQFLAELPKTLMALQTRLLDRARKFRDTHVFDVKTVADIAEFYKADKMGLVRADAAILNDPALVAVRKEFSLSPRCLPFDAPGTVLIGRSY
jgi:prolyl-tRNA synthetase